MGGMAAVTSEQHRHNNGHVTAGNGEVPVFAEDDDDDHCLLEHIIYSV